jgi:PAS domain S-box-containing protein
MTDGLDKVSLGESGGALLAAVLDQTHDCIELLGLDGSVRYVNRQGALAMDSTALGELLGQSYLTRWPEDVRPRVRAAISAAGRGEQGRFRASRQGPGEAPSWWDVTVSPVRTGGGPITHLVAIARDMTAELLERERVAAISLEMRHRLKNALTVAAGIVMMNARSRPEAASFAEEIAARFALLADVERLVLDPDADNDLAQIVPALVKAYGKGAGLDFGELPSVSLSDQAMQALALCFGELATNSMKYGALRDGRRLRIEGRIDDGDIELVWSEPTDFGAARPGSQGLDLLGRLIRNAGGSIGREIEPGHMIAIIRLPLPTATSDAPGSATPPCGDG